MLRGIFAERWRCGDGLDEYLKALHARRTDGAGVFGVKVHWAQLEAAAAGAGLHAAELLGRLAPAGTLLRTQRLDRAAQAVSLWRAERSGVWSLPVSEAPEEPLPAYDFDAIAACLAEIERGEDAWDRLVGDAPSVEYERLAARYADTIAAAATCLGAGAVEVPAPRSRKLADGRSVELADRFRADLAAARA